MIAEHDANGQRIVRGEHIEVATCWHHCVGSIEKEMEANARLIAAAPDMLAALQAILEIAEIDKSFSESAAAAFIRVKSRSAIAKAEGEA